MSPLKQPSQQGLLRTGQTTAYAARDDGDQQKGIAKLYQILTAGQFSLTAAVYVPAYAAATISFDAASHEVRDTANGMATFKTNDVIRVRGAGVNDLELTVATGNVAAKAVVTEDITDMAAGAWITIAKQALQSNNAVQDLETGLMWMRYGSYSPAKLGAASDGLLLWTATAVEIHAANNDLEMIAGGKGSCTVKIVGGAGEVLVYWPGYTYSFTAFANAVNKLFGFKCVSVTVNGADLDIVLATGNQTCIAEGAGVNGAINLSCNGIFPFANACNVAGVGGYSDWRVPNIFEQVSLLNVGLAGGYPNTTAFLSIPAVNNMWASSTNKNDSTKGWYQLYTTAVGGPLVYSIVKTAQYFTMLVRGGV